MTEYLFLSIPTNSGGSLLHSYICQCVRVAGILDREAHWITPRRAWPQPAEYAKFKRLYTLGSIGVTYDIGLYDPPTIVDSWHRLWDDLDPGQVPAGVSNVTLSIKSTMCHVLLNPVARHLTSLGHVVKFIFGVRDPYAFCEGVKRREGHPVAMSAEHWCRVTARQLDTSQHFPHEWVRYEDLTERTGEVVKRLRGLSAALSDLNIDGTVGKPTLDGVQKKVQNLNPRQIARLSDAEIDEISKVLAVREVERRAGYEIR